MVDEKDGDGKRRYFNLFLPETLLLAEDLASTCVCSSLA